jgi:regulator of sirC expression with transglutaminase-like and TPR domain
MNALAPSPEPGVLSDRQKAALITLLGDDDTTVYQAVRDKILSCGPAAEAWIKPHLLSSDPVIRRRCHELVQHIGRGQADTRFLGFCLRQGEDLDLEQGIWSLAQTQYPDINVGGYVALLDTYASDLRETMDLSCPAKELLGNLNAFLFEELGFTGNEQDYYDPDNSYLNRVMDRRTGNPISLCVIYLLLGRRLRLPLGGIGLPGHFICRYQTSTEELYIDAFNQGRLLTRADCIKYLVQSQHGIQDGFLTPVSSRRMLMRVCANLHQIYQQMELPDEASRVQRYLVALAK